MGPQSLPAEPGNRSQSRLTHSHRKPDHMTWSSLSSQEVAAVNAHTTASSHDLSLLTILPFSSDKLSRRPQSASSYSQHIVAQQAALNTGWTNWLSITEPNGQSALAKGAVGGRIEAVALWWKRGQPQSAEAFSREHALNAHLISLRLQSRGAQ